MRECLNGRNRTQRRTANTDQDEVVVLVAVLGGERLDLGDQCLVVRQIDPLLVTGGMLGQMRSISFVAFDAIDRNALSVNPFASPTAAAITFR